MLSKRVYISDMHMSSKDRADDFDTGNGNKETMMINFMKNIFTMIREQWVD